MLAVSVLLQECEERGLPQLTIILFLKDVEEVFDQTGIDFTLAGKQIRNNFIDWLNGAE